MSVRETVREIERGRGKGRGRVRKRRGGGERDCDIASYDQCADNVVYINYSSYIYNLNFPLALFV